MRQSFSQTPYYRLRLYDLGFSSKHPFVLFCLFSTTYSPPGNETNLARAGADALRHSLQCDDSKLMAFGEGLISSQPGAGHGGLKLIDGSAAHSGQARHFRISTKRGVEHINTSMTIVEMISN